jgi:hypothetical protein
MWLGSVDERPPNRSRMVTLPSQAAVTPPKCRRVRPTQETAAIGSLHEVFWSGGLLVGRRVWYTKCFDNGRGYVPMSAVAGGIDDVG